MKRPLMRSNHLYHPNFRLPGHPVVDTHHLTRGWLPTSTPAGKICDRTKMGIAHLPDKKKTGRPRHELSDVRDEQV